MNSLRKWRFPILIGSGLIAAGVLVYFANTHVSTDKTQGAIGKRDVYRDGQVNSADVATPGSAPVATEAILQSSEYKELAKNQAFQELFKDQSFAMLSKNGLFVGLLARSEFRAAVQDAHFAQLVNSALFQTALRTHQDLTLAMRQDAQFKAMAGSHSMDLLFRSDAFQKMAADKLFDHLLESNAFRSALSFPAFSSLVMRSDFQRALENGSMAQLTVASGPDGHGASR